MDKVFLTSEGSHWKDILISEDGPEIHSNK